MLHAADIYQKFGAVEGLKECRRLLHGVDKEPNILAPSLFFWLPVSLTHRRLRRNVLTFFFDERSPEPYLFRSRTLYYIRYLPTRRPSLSRLRTLSMGLPQSEDLAAIVVHSGKPYNQQSQRTYEIPIQM